MKKVFTTVMAMVVLTAHADEAAQAKAELRAGQTFQCGGFIKSSVVLASADETAVQCYVLGDVRGSGSNTVVIPKWSRFFGWKKGNRLEWTSWTAPDGTVFGDAILHGVALTSNIDAKSDVYNVTALRDISVRPAAQDVS